MSANNNSFLMVSGINNVRQLGETQNGNNNSIIQSPCISKINSLTLSSYSIFNNHSIWVTKDGKAYASGYNTSKIIIGSLPESILQGAEICINDSNGRQCKILSVMCGISYTLYLVIQSDGSKKIALVYQFTNKMMPIFINIKGPEPMALFGGRSTAAVIDKEGGFIPITGSLIKSPESEVRSTFLPGHDKVVSVACLVKTFVVVGENGLAYESSNEKLSFHLIPELSDNKIIDVSGCENNCLAVSSDGNAFARGGSYCGALGLGEDIKKASKFKEIIALSNYKIKKAYKGLYHSLFQTEEGMILSCGYNSNGELLLNNFIRQDVFTPKETLIHASFCIAGERCSVAFVGEVPPNMPNRRITYKKAQNNEMTSTVKPFNEFKKEIDEKNLEIEKIKKEIEDKNSEIDNLNQTIEKLKSNKFMQEDQIKKDYHEISEENFKLKKENDILKKQLRRYEENESISMSMKDIPINENFFIGIDDEEHQKVLNIIGEGKTSIAYKVVDERTSEIMCKKVIIMSDDIDAFKTLQNSIKEIEILHKINHPSICKAIGFNSHENISNEDEDNEENTTIALFLEYLPYKLKDILNCPYMNNTLKTKIALEVAFGMDHIHHLGMIHRNLQIDSIMTNYIFEAKITDFDLAHVIDQENFENSLTKGIGAFGFISPEMLSDENYTNKTDIYSYGIVLFVIFTGSLPKQNLKNKANKKPIVLPNPSFSISENCISIIQKCTNIDPNERPSFAEIIEEMKAKSFKLAEEVDSAIINNRYCELKKIQIQK